jgi:hypothetical protein
VRECNMDAPLLQAVLTSLSGTAIASFRRS